MKLKGRKIGWPHMTLVYVLIVAMVVIGFFQIQRIQHEANINNAKAAYNLCVSGNKFRTNLRTYIDNLVPPDQRNLPKSKAFIANTNKSFPNNNCSAIVKGPTGKPVATK